MSKFADRAGIVRNGKNGRGLRMFAASRGIVFASISVQRGQNNKGKHVETESDTGHKPASYRLLVVVKKSFSH